MEAIDSGSERFVNDQVITSPFLVTVRDMRLRKVGDRLDFFPALSLQQI
jgi:hypothetical protein